MILNEPFLNWLYLTNLTPPTLTLQETPNEALSRDHLTLFLTIDSVCQIIDIESHQNLRRVRIFFSFIFNIFQVRAKQWPKSLRPLFPYYPTGEYLSSQFQFPINGGKGPFK